MSRLDFNVKMHRILKIINIKTTSYNIKYFNIVYTCAVLIRCSLKDGDSRRNWTATPMPWVVFEGWRFEFGILWISRDSNINSNAWIPWTIEWERLRTRRMRLWETRETQNHKKTSQKENGELKEALCFLEAEGYAYKEFHCMHSPLAVVSTCPFSFWRQFHHNFLIFIFPRLFFCPQRVGNVRKLLVAWEREKAP